MRTGEEDTPRVLFQVNSHGVLVYRPLAVLAFPSQSPGPKKKAKKKSQSSGAPRRG